MRTFPIHLDDADAAKLLPMPPTAMPQVDDFHPLVALPDGTLIICVHDDANDCTYPTEVSRKVIEDSDSPEQVEMLLSRVVKAVMN